MDILFELDEMPRLRLEKCKSLMQLASDVKQGVIVELGTYVGLGAIALALTADEGTHIFTIDDYVDKRGWASEHYGEEDHLRFQNNINQAGMGDKITLVRNECLAACQEWQLPIDLIFWDLGINGRLREDFTCWSKHLKRGGIFAIHDTLNQILGSRQIIKDSGYTYREMLPGGVFVMVKP